MYKIKEEGTMILVDCQFLGYTVIKYLYRFINQSYPEMKFSVQAVLQMSCAK